MQLLGLCGRGKFHAIFVSEMRTMTESGHLINLPYCRCFKLVKVKWRDIVMPDPSSISHVMQRYLACKPLVLSNLTTYFEVRLRNRKGWQQKVDKGVSETDLQGASLPW